MRRSTLLSVAIATVLAASVPSHGTGASALAGPSHDADGIAEVTQTPDEALVQDLSLVAKSQGWNHADAEVYHRAEQAIGRIAAQVAAERPEAFVGSALSEDPHGPPTLYVKGPADKLITNLVEAAGIEIIVADNQPYSFDELEVRKLRMHQALQALGFESVVTRVNITGAGMIQANATWQEGLPETVDEILAQLPADLRSSVELTVHEEPMIEEEGAFGGMRLLRDGMFDCTSGWTVQQVGSTTSGISGAGHCFFNDQVDHPGTRPTRA